MRRVKNYSLNIELQSFDRVFTNNNQFKYLFFIYKPKKSNNNKTMNDIKVMCGHYHLVEYRISLIVMQSVHLIFLKPILANG